MDYTSQYNYYQISWILLSIIHHLKLVIIISNMIIFGYFTQTCMITRVAYKLTKNKYGYEVYKNA